MSRFGALAAAICASLLTQPVWGQSTPVRSGEHANFTRLVFPAQDGLGWAISRPAPDRVALVFDDPNLSLDTSEVFGRIPRTRLAALRTENQTMVLDLACTCDVDVNQIGSGHIVIDIAAAAQTAAPAPTAPPPRPDGPALPLRLPPLATLSEGLAMRTAAAPVLAAAPIPVAAPEPALPPVESTRAAQISIREIERASLLPDHSLPTPQEVTRLTCPEEAIAADLFRRDPTTALAEIPALRLQLSNEADQPVASAHRALAETYLAAGLGAEAAHIMRQSPEPADDILAGIAGAIDGLPDFAESPVQFEAACGPATAILALLTGLSTSSWASVDGHAMARFIDTLPRVTRDDLIPRLQPALARLGEPELLALEPVQRDAPPPLLPVVAGTDSAAISATIAALATDEGPADEDVLANGLALRASTPEGPLRDELDRALAIDLALAGHHVEASQIIGNRTDLAEAVLAEAVAILPPEEAAVAAIRLRPALAPGGTGAQLAVETLQTFGLGGLAGGFGARPAPNSPVPDPDPAPAEEAWIDRDFASLDPETPRGQIAALRQQRNEGAPPDDDFSRATAAAEESARLSDLVLSLIEPPS